uniref:Copia protein n=1 Tax=Tanacetum cinerariifolium TaxID=118510 RepID=A0A6L2NLM0_TANCI|nr:copia protein [Tanacetum cinerariifolium]
MIEVQTSGSGNTFLLAVAFFFRQWEVPSGSGNFLTSSGNVLCILFPTSDNLERPNAESSTKIVNTIGPINAFTLPMLFLAYASFMDFTVYQIDVKSTFLYGIIEEEVYVIQPPGFVDLEFLDRAYKVEKALYGLHQALRACVKSTTTQMETHKLLSKDANGTNVDVYLYRQVLWLQNQLLDYAYNFKQTKIHVDNTYKKRLIEMVKIHTDYNVADLLTKAFDVTRFQFLIASIGLLNP